MTDPTYATARLAMLLYAAALALHVGRPARPSFARRVYSAGLVALFVHIATAFHVHHHWNHAAARAHVEQRTAELTGVASGAGLWLNYIFAAVWLADATYWWVAGDQAYQRRRLAYSLAIHAFLLFIAFNATVVFAQKVAGAVAMAVCAALSGLIMTARARHTRNAATTAGCKAAP